MDVNTRGSALFPCIYSLVWHWQPPYLVQNSFLLTSSSQSANNFTNGSVHCGGFFALFAKFYKLYSEITIEHSASMADVMSLMFNFVGCASV